MISISNLVPLGKLARSTIRVKMMASLLLIVVPLIGFIIYSNVYAIEVVRHQVAESNKDLLTLYRDQLDGRLNEVDNYLFGLMSDTDLSDMTFLTSPDERVFAAHRLTLEISKAIMRFPVIDGLFVYLPADERYLYAYRDRSTMNDRMNMKAHITQEVSLRPVPDKQNLRKWYITKRGDQIYLVRAFMLNDASIIGAWINANSFLTPLDLLGIGETGAAVLGDDAGNAIVNRNFVKENDIEIRPAASTFYLTGEDERFLAVGEPSGEGEFGLYAFIPEDQILQHLPTLRIISFLLPFASVLILLLGFLLLRKTLLVPINRLVQTMNRIRQGNLDMQIKQFPTSHEFQVVNDTFNHMMSEIKDLRISVYEEQLNKQKVELQHLQLQIKPHFFINTLNTMHTLARMKDLERMEELSLCLVRYFRYMFQSNLNFVTLRDELQHVRNYMRIQELRYPDQIAFDFEAPDFLLRTPVPPLVVHSFVENAVKHGVTLDDPVRIEVRLEMIETPQTVLLIQVQDTGPGFKPGVIENLERDRRVVDDEGEHIGIWNVKQRLRLLYGEQASVVLRNAEPNGAVVRVTLPLAPDTGTTLIRGGTHHD
ncbi:sensor histidine kinase [Paenibacillus antri]|nr:histidine kinase [Paenibacillus antri]